MYQNYPLALIGNHGNQILLTFSTFSEGWYPSQYIIKQSITYFLQAFKLGANWLYSFLDSSLFFLKR